MRELIEKINEIKKAMNDLTKLNKIVLEKY